MIDKSAVTAVFEALGPERVARALTNADGHTWEDCFLARAYGAPGELERAIRRDPSRRSRTSSGWRWRLLTQPSS